MPMLPGHPVCVRIFPLIVAASGWRQMLEKDEDEDEDEEKEKDKDEDEEDEEEE